MSTTQNEEHVVAEHKWPICMYDTVSDVVGIPYNYGQVNKFILIDYMDRIVIYVQFTIDCNLFKNILFYVYV